MKSSIRKTLSIAMLMGIAGAASAQGVISTVAGTGTSGFSGDGSDALSAALSAPQGVALDAAGNIYIADMNNHRVRKVDAVTGIMSTYAGGGSSSSFGIPAITGQMFQPRHVFVNSIGDVFVTDHFYDMTFRIEQSSGLLYSRCGHHTQGCDGDGGDGSLARMMLPNASCEDAAGNTYLADAGCGKIRKVDASGITSTFATMSGVTGLFVDPSAPNDLYVSFGSGHKISKIDIPTGTVTDVVGTGTAGYSGDGLAPLSATLGNPSAIFIGNNHDLYICDATYHVVRKVELDHNIIYTIAGTGSAGYTGDGGESPLAKLNNPQGIWVSNGYVYIADAGNHRVRKITPKGFKPNGTMLQSNEVSIFPNPTTGSFTLATGETLDNAQVVVYNVLGAKVYNTTLNGNSNVIDLSGQPSGVYTVVLQTASGVQSIKVTRN